MRKLRIILFFVFLLASLIGVYYVLMGGVRTYSVRQEKFNLSYDIDKQEGTIVDKVVSFSNNNKLLEAVANKDTAKLSAYTCEIIDRYKVDEVAVVDNIGAVTNHCLLNSRNNYDQILIEDAFRYVKQLSFQEVLMYHRVFHDSVFTVAVSRIPNPSNTTPGFKGYFAVIDCLNLSIKHDFTISYVKDSVYKASNNYLFTRSLYNPEHQVYGYVHFEFSDSYKQMVQRMNIFFIPFFVLVVLVSIYFVYRYLKVISICDYIEDYGDTKRFNAYYESMRQSFAGLVMFDPLGNINFANYWFFNVSGYSLDELVNEHPTLFVTEEGSSFFTYDFWRRLSNGIAWKGEIILVKKDNSQLKLKSTFSPFKNKEFIAGYTAFFEDITAEDVRVAQLLEFYRKYSVIVENCSDVIWIYDYKNSKFSFVSPSVKVVTGYTPDDIIGRPLEDFLEPLSFKKVSKAFLDYQKDNIGIVSNRGNLRLTCRLKCYDESYLDMDLSMTAMFSDNTNIPTEIVAITRDITENQKIHKRLSDSENKYRIIAENTADMIWKIDANDFSINYVSRSGTSMLGYSHPEFLNMNLKDLLTTDIWTKISNKAKRLVDLNVETTNYRFKCSAICKNGDIKELESVVSIITDSHGYKEFLGVSRDVTESLKNERRLRDTLSQMQLLLETLPAKIFMKDLYGQYILANSRFADGIGITLDKIVGYTSDEIPIPEDAKVLLSQDEVILKTGMSFINQEVFIKSFNDKGKWYSVSQVPYSDNGKVIGIIGILVDISNLKLYEQILKDTNIQFENTIKNFSDVFVRVDLHGVIQMANPAICEFLGVDSVDQVLGRKVQDLVDSDVDWVELVTGGRVYNYAFKMRNLLGKNMFCETSIIVFNDKYGVAAGYEAVARDITERKLHEQQLNTLTQDLMSSLEQTKIQKNMIESAHRGITESLNYAKRIQDALLKSSLENIRRYMPNSFMLYQPREIVGGDFAYVSQIANGIVCAVGDCTGHGIPGALMSVLAISLLNDIFSDSSDGFTPAEILENLRERIIATLSNSLILRDGLDICMFYKKFDDHKIVYSGANTPLYICRNSQTICLKPTRCPIGLYPVQSRFENIEFDILKDDMLYLSSDGYQDQFGISENRKYSQKDFMDLLAKISPEPVEKQQDELINNLATWRGSRKQTDDITVFGIRMEDIF